MVGLGTAGEESSVAGSFSGLGAVVNDCISDEGVISGDSGYFRIALFRSGCMDRKYGSDLFPSLRLNGKILNRSYQSTRRAVKELNAELIRTVVCLSGIDEGQVASVFGVLHKSINPRATGCRQSVGSAAIKQTESS